MKHSKILTIILGLCLSLLLTLPLYAGVAGWEQSDGITSGSTTREKPMIPDELQAYGTVWPTTSTIGFFTCAPFTASADVWDMELIAGGYGGSSTTNASTLQCHVTNVPTGALVYYFEIEACDVDPNDAIYGSLWELAGAGGSSGANFIAAIDTGVAATDGCTWWSTTSFTPFTWDNWTRTYVIQVVDDNAYNAGTGFMAARLNWMRQISPPPGTPTFGDVNTSDWFYQGVEALAYAGITTGCGGGNFCPNVAVTRAQMAVFLARALGLHWPY